MQLWPARNDRRSRGSTPVAFFGFHFASSPGWSRFRHQSSTPVSKPHNDSRDATRQPYVNLQAYTEQTLDHSVSVAHLAVKWDTAVELTPLPIHLIL